MRENVKNFTNFFEFFFFFNSKYPNLLKMSCTAIKFIGKVHYGLNHRTVAGFGTKTNIC